MIYSNQFFTTIANETIVEKTDMAQQVLTRQLCLCDFLQYSAYIYAYMDARCWPWQIHIRYAATYSYAIHIMISICFPGCFTLSTCWFNEKARSRWNFICSKLVPKKGLLVYTSPDQFGINCYKLYTYNINHYIYIYIYMIVSIIDLP